MLPLGMLTLGQLRQTRPAGHCSSPNAHRLLLRSPYEAADLVQQDGGPPVLKLSSSTAKVKATSCPCRSHACGHSPCEGAQKKICPPTGRSIAPFATMPVCRAQSCGLRSSPGAAPAHRFAVSPTMARPPRRGALRCGASVANPVSGKRFDYIIVGGGSAGCVLANRLVCQVQAASQSSGSQRSRTLVGAPTCLTPTTSAIRSNGAAHSGVLGVHGGSG